MIAIALRAAVALFAIFIVCVFFTSWELMAAATFVALLTTIEAYTYYHRQAHHADPAQ